MVVSSAVRPVVTHSPQLGEGVARDIARLAVRSLHTELTLYPKPGLVSRLDNGAHCDMNAAAFVKSLFALRHYFVAIAQAGGNAAPMTVLRALGLAAEGRMLCATRGVNTHRGAIFALGLLCAAAGRAAAEGHACSDAAMRDIIATQWRRDLIAAPAPRETVSHGLQMAARYHAAGARGEAMRGFPSIFDVALPALRDALVRGADPERAGVHAFFTLLAVVIDTNVLYRGGAAALAHLQQGAAEFLARGSVFAHDWLPRAEALHRHCSGTRISPGGCADLFAATWFVHLLQTR
jgi:triphosphoribosyl-dephospho-CoA synthase